MKRYVTSEMALKASHRPLNRIVRWVWLVILAICLLFPSTLAAKLLGWI